MGIMHTQSNEDNVQKRHNKSQSKGANTIMVRIDKIFKNILMPFVLMPVSNLYIAKSIQISTYIIDVKSMID